MFYFTYSFFVFVFFASYMVLINSLYDVISATRRQPRMASVSPQRGTEDASFIAKARRCRNSRSALLVRQMASCPRYYHRVRVVNRVISVRRVMSAPCVIVTGLSQMCTKCNM